ncbi:hypothetical protein LTR36_008833 [Oleoguttula mirabilis]|uniref:HRDC domain-containing protein n=1 Tax=Oleoguttula mirabilis TaxID=1507867 RepID=A0AAV9J7X3_9PEZI|nr:hypothetical protein LTR36_008833 [Oleoguttula mirabilis]
MDKLSDFASLQSTITSALVSTTRSASQLANEDLPFHRSLDTALSASLDRQNARLLGLAERLLGTATAHTETVRPAPRLRDIDAVEGNWRAVVDVVDSLLERADTALDEFTGAVKRLSPGARDTQTPERVPAARPSRIAASLRSRDIEKPQLSFKHVPTNDEGGEFVPLLQSRPHALVPGAESAGGHPYQAEIEQYRYPASVYTYAEPIPYHPFENTTATYVDTEESMYEMLEELKQAKVLAVDLEHHDQRSYIGIVSLMQISTRDKDWIVDTLKPWRRELQCLNEVFANPNIVKVLHGAFMDVMWLQRDLGLYLVGLFDTHYAARAMGYPGGSYAYLLKRFADVDAQKQYQLADWRIRPLPQELLDYARSDTHYLLYIFDNMRNELITKSNLEKPDHEGDKIWDVLTKSSETALQQYTHPVYDTELGQGSMGWYKLLYRTPALLTKEQFSVFRAVHRWRDGVAREQDDSVHYIMPNHQIFSIAKALPTTKAELLGIAQPASQTVRLRADELASVIFNAREAGGDGPEMLELLSKVEPQFPRKPAAKEVPPSHSVAASLPQAESPAVDGGEATVTSSLPLRSTTSTFWGSAFGSSVHQDRSASTISTVSLTVPLPPLTADVFADPAEVTATPVKASEPSSPIPTPASAEDQEVEDDVFVLKQMGKKRKRTEPLDGMAAQSDEVAIPDDETEQMREKAERKKAKKEAKRAAKAAGSNGTVGAEDVEADEQPFDYASAPSVLNPPRESKEEMKARRKKEVNPYAKSMDAPKGMPRTQKERAGRSMTYKS